MPFANLLRRRSSTLQKQPQWQEAAQCMPAHLSQDTICPICLDDEDVSDVLQLGRCKHAFHAACLNIWLEKNSTCPVCRTIVAGSVHVEYIGVDYISMPLPRALPFGKALQNIARKHNRHNSLRSRMNTKKNCSFMFNDDGFALTDRHVHRGLDLRKRTSDRSIFSVDVPHVKEIYRYGNIMLLCVSATLDHEVKKLKVFIMRHGSVQTNANTLANLRSICKDVRTRMGYCMTPLRVAPGQVEHEAAVERQRQQDLEQQQQQQLNQVPILESVDRSAPLSSPQPRSRLESAFSLEIELETDVLNSSMV